MSALDNVLGRLEGVRKTGDGHQGKCPAHDDRHASLSIGAGDDGRVLLNCHAGCDTADVVAAIGLELGDLFEREESNGRDEIVATYDYEDEHGALLYQVLRKSNKKFLQRRPDGRGGWVWKLGAIRRVPYRLQRVLEAVADGETIYVVEGEKDVHALEAAGVVATCNPGGADKWRKEYAKPLSGADVVVVADKDGPGRKHAAKVAASLADVAQNVRIVEAADGKDAADHLAAGHTVDEFVSAGEPEPKTEAKPVIAPTDGPPPKLAGVLDAVAKFVRRFVVLTDSQAVAVALWIIHTHAIEASDTTPYLSVSSAEKRSGKTRLLEVLELVVKTPIQTANVSEAYLFRSIEAEQPTILFDEIDAIFGAKARDREDLRGMLNAGFRRGAVTGRMGGAQMNERQTFQVYCAKAFAGIGELPDTIRDRAIPIRLERRTRAEKIERFRRRDIKAEAETMHAAVEAVAAHHLDALTHARTDLPHELDDRAQDCWEALLAIADRAGGGWSDRAREAAVSLSTGEAREDDSLGARLLADIRDVFEANGTKRYPTVDLIAELAKVEESPWGDWKQGKSITPQGLGKLLKPYRIKTMEVWADGAKARGYKIEQFEDAWLRVLGMEGGRGGRGGRSESPSQAIPTTPTTPTALDAEQGNGKRLLVAGDPGYPMVVDRALSVGEITEAEFHELRSLHRFVRNGRPKTEPEFAEDWEIPF